MGTRRLARPCRAGRRACESSLLAGSFCLSPASQGERVAKSKPRLHLVEPPDTKAIAAGDYAQPVYAIAFDMDTDSMKKLYGKPSWENGYGEIREILARHGFAKQQDSVYFGDRGTVRAVSCVIAVQDLARDCRGSRRRCATSGCFASRRKTTSASPWRRSNRCLRRVISSSRRRRPGTSADRPARPAWTTAALLAAARLHTRRTKRRRADLALQCAFSA